MRDVTGSIGKEARNMQRLTNSLDLAIEAFKYGWKLYKTNRYVTSIYVGSRYHHEGLVIGDELKLARIKIQRRLVGMRTARRRKKDLRGRFI